MLKGNQLGQSSHEVKTHIQRNTGYLLFSCCHLHTEKSHERSCVPLSDPESAYKKIFLIKFKYNIF